MACTRTRRVVKDAGDIDRAWPVQSARGTATALAREKGDPDVMEQTPRKKDEPIINDKMRLGITVQAIVQTAAVLGAFILGLYWHVGEPIPDGTNALLYLLQYDWTGVDILTTQTMAFATLSLAQMFRAYTVRSEKASLFSIGIFSNRYAAVC